MLGFLDSLLLQPLMLIYSVVFDALRATSSVGLQLIQFGIAVNLILLPLYRAMEVNSRRTKDLRERVGAEVARMRRHFKGRERYFYIRTVHRQYRYNPISVLWGSADLFLQVLVFATVFHFLSHLPVLEGASFGPIADLSRPDALLFGVNVLPLLMTTINIGAVLAYVDDPGRRRQAFLLAAVFIVLLYASPSGLVLYWTTNNLFSLVRSLVQRRLVPRLPARITRVLAEVGAQR